VSPSGHPRSGYFDLLRALAILRVVAYHSLGLAWLTIAFPAVGVMFALAGSLMAASLDRAGPAAVGHRLRRLLPPVWMLAAVCVPVMVVGGMRLDWSVLLWLFPVRDPPANTWGAASLGMIWYLREYLWFVLLSPLALPAFRRWPTLCLLTPLGLLIVFTLTGVKAPGPISDFALYGDCWLLGFAQHDGLLRRIRRSTLLLAVGALATAGAAWFLTHPGARGHDLNDIPLGNALWSMAFLLVLLGLVPSLLSERQSRERPRTAWLLKAFNSRAMTIYLWHQMAIGLTLVAAGRWRVDLTGPDGRLLLLTGVGTLLVVAAVGFGWVEDLAARRRPALLPGGAGPGWPSHREAPPAPAMVGAPASPSHHSPPDQAWDLPVRLPAQRRPDDLAVAGHRGAPAGRARLHEVEPPPTGGQRGPA
jgi:peptidoglycan/LPS O-acetylase OafA/YrhL